ncbi:hypothetical protein ACFLS8_04425 [Chloroflexota bacterium]
MATEVSVTAYLATQIITGGIVIPDGMRLSDILNGSPLNYPKNGHKFIELSDVAVRHVDGKVEKAEKSYINKEAIQLLTTLDRDAARGIGTEGVSKNYPYLQKKPKWTKMCMPSYEVTGNLYCCAGQAVPYLQDARLLFLPLTDVNLRTIEESNHWKVAFAAVNRSQILSLRHDQN